MVVSAGEDQRGQEGPSAKLSEGVSATDIRESPPGDVSTHPGPLCLDTHCLFHAGAVLPKRFQAILTIPSGPLHQKKLYYPYFPNLTQMV